MPAGYAMRAAPAHHSPATAISPEQFARWLDRLGPFEHAPILAIAVSGGADSMALMLLAHDWAKARGGKVVALTVDHGLRPESAAEAANIANWCHQRAISHHTLRWQLPAELPSGIQAHARTARYDLLTRWCRQHHVLHLLTAHHGGDQAETLILRTGRGSGLDGLAGIASISYKQGVRLLRPLLPAMHEQLVQTLIEAGQDWVEDPTNDQSCYTRNVIRKAMAIDQYKQASQLATSFGTIRNKLENNTVSYLTNAVSLYSEAFAKLHTNGFFSVPREYGIRALTALSMSLSGESYPSRTDKLERLYDELKSPFTRRTFAGLVFINRAAKNHILVCREPNAVQASVRAAQANVFWDRRFQVQWHTDQVLELRSLGQDGIRYLRDTAPVCLGYKEKPVLAVLPSLWDLEKPVAVPHISYRDATLDLHVCSARFAPAKALAGTAFFSNNENSRLGEDI